MSCPQAAEVGRRWEGAVVGGSHARPGREVMTAFQVGKLCLWELAEGQPPSRAKEPRARLFEGYKRVR